MLRSYLQVNGHRLRYDLRGSTGPLAIVGHGLLGSIEQVDANLPGLDALLDDVRLLRYDARGHGESEGPEDPALYTWDALGQDMLAFADAQGVDRAIFGGGSMGAATALWIAIERPERVMALVAAVPPPLGHDTMRDQAEQGAITMLEALAITIEQHGMERTVLPQFAPTEEEGEERAHWLLGQNPHTFIPAVRGLIRATYHDPERYRDISAPTLVIAHEGDPLHPMRAANLLASSIPGARLVTGDYPGYWRDHPDELVAEIRAFLASVG